MGIIITFERLNIKPETSGVSVMETISGIWVFLLILKYAVMIYFHKISTMLIKYV